MTVRVARTKRIKIRMRRRIAGKTGLSKEKRSDTGGQEGLRKKYGEEQTAAPLLSVFAV